jgi:uncharacterized protein (TIGR03118 family)
VEQALDSLVLFPGAHYNAPVFSVRAETPPGGLGFLSSGNLGPQYQDALFEGEARDNFPGSPFADPREQFNGALFVFHPTSDRSRLDLSASPFVRASDGVFENNSDFDLMGDTSFLLGTNFGVLTDIQTGPDGNLYVVSLSGGSASIGGAVFEIYNRSALNPVHDTSLVANTATPHDSTGQALDPPEVVDPNLVNPWGISFSPTSPFWVANQGTGTSTLYAGDHLQPDGTVSPIMRNATVVTLPVPSGTVWNGSAADFHLSNGTAASFLFDTLGGSIYGWNGAIGSNPAELKNTITGAFYTGMAIGNNGSGNFLYAADDSPSRGGIDVFDTNFNRVTPGPTTFVFQDPNLPVGLTPWRPFNIQNLGGTLYVTYRNVSPGNQEFGGIVDAYDTNGNFLRRVVTGGLNAPWGLALAPAGFGNLGGALLVGNFGLGDGKINAFDPNTGQFLGYLTEDDGEPEAYEGLWAIAFGNGGSGGDQTALYFAAGINRTGAGSVSAREGLFGSIRFNSPSGPLPGQLTTLDEAPAQGVAPAGGGPRAAGLGLIAGTPSATPAVVPAPVASPAPLPAPVDGLTAAQIFGSGRTTEPDQGSAALGQVLVSDGAALTSVFQTDPALLEGATLAGL